MNYREENLDEIEEKETDVAGREVLKDVFEAMEEMNHLKRCLDEKEEPEPKMAKKEGFGLGSRLKDSDMRSYQLEAYEAALQRNTIGWLETGSGKTMIAIMLMKEIARQLRDGGDKRLIIFLAPTVHLVNQQYSVIKTHTDLHVAEYYGAKGIDDWDLRCWQKETCEKEVMVMTPQILLDALRNAFITVDMVRLLIFDECHRATGNHPYAKIMLEYYHKTDHKPKVFGMTASPVIRKGVSSAEDCEYQITQLEEILDSKVFILEDRTELEVHVPMAKEIKRYYGSWFVNEDLKGELDCLWTKFDTTAAVMESPTQMQFMEKSLRAKLTSFHWKILYCLEHLGILCAYEAVMVCMQRDGVAPNIEENACPHILLRNYLKEALHIFKGYLSAEACDLLETEATLDPVYMNFISPKLCELVNTINALRNQKQVLCMIFVERIITAKVICWLIKKLKFLSHLSCDYLTGNNSAVNGLTVKRQRMIMDSFREGKVNLLLTTDVAEEGIDVHNCSCVIRFDLPKTIRSYIQSRGRARYADSLYVLMLERGNEEHKDLLYEIFRSERTMQDATSSRDKAPISKICSKDDEPVYTVSSTGATVTADSSVSLIFSYCQKLPGDKYFHPKPKFHYDLSGGFSECTLTLPPNAAFRHLKGPPAKSNHHAKKLVCLDACKKLHEMKALDDHLLPLSEQLPDHTLAKEVNSAPGAGTTRRKELHGSATADALSGTWANVLSSITLQAYSLFFSCNTIEENYPGFIFLIKEELDEDVAHAEIDLFLHNNKVVKARASPCGQVNLDTDQLMRSKVFHELFFNGLFGKLFHISKSSGVRQKILAMDDTALWPFTNMYMLLPMSQQSAQSQGSPSIDWTIIDSCFAVAEFLKANNLPMAMNNFHVEAMQRQDDKKPEKIHLANTSCGFHDLKDMVVLANHTGRFYYVADLVNDATADSPFDGSCESARPSYSSYTDYFKKKYGINLHYNTQPLLRLKQSHNPHNLLFSKEGHEGGSLNSNGKSDPIQPAKQQQGYVYMPPELLIRLDVLRDILRSFYLLPSLVHRMESMILASQLRRAVGFHPNGHHIPTDLILEAVTTRRCAEAFCLERLELLGDSVLKYVVSCNLFLKYPEKHEGQLSALRSLVVCNATLHRLATGRNLQNYIRDAPFDPLRWLAPGQRISRPVPCKCGVNSREVPLTHPADVESGAIKIGVTCELGHRWLCSKTISDCLEALIGAYYISGGLEAACLFMRWVGIDCEHDQALVDEAIRKTSRLTYAIEDKDIDSLESKLGYKFLNRGLLLEAITHASQQEAGLGCCYQRLEFLGDSVLDLLITWHLFESHKDIDQGELTDLRSASVNNEKFAQASVKHNLQHHLLHGSELLLMQIKDYVKFMKSFPENEPLPAYSKSKGPKVLGDLVESIAGAILIDSKLNLGEVWRVFKPILSPFPTPEDLQLHPLRELGEICGEAGSPLCTECRKEGDQTIAKLTVQLKDGQLTAEGCDKTKNTALEQAALLLLDAMEKKGISHKRSIWRGKSERVQNILPCSHEQTTGLSPVERHHGEHSSTRSLDPTVSKVSIDMKKGGPRTSLFQLCRDMNWVRPTFEPRASGPRFISKAILHVPDSDNIEVEGEEKADKKSSMDSAALILLYKLEELAKCIIEEC
ncbi:endoribonuclease Dicer homolog 3a-like isoform X2 [Nymphaea colorata]|uniref:endoribonuclease Dicer homolog 3a-like isoform X2 n=1 Tax=Nymphaea colorata TaxID=210225 RepID=UPI00129E57DF|nr:endoribonuclease Dicer homolog 3a-like isoform X2 [Nymphaea colorata]